MQLTHPYRHFTTEQWRLLVETQYAGMENEREKTRGQAVLR